MRPGNYVFSTVRKRDCARPHPNTEAMAVSPHVVSRPAPGRVVFDAGSKTLTYDGARGFGAVTGHGRSIRSLETTQPDPDDRDRAAVGGATPSRA